MVHLSIIISRTSELITFSDIIGIIYNIALIFMFEKALYMIVEAGAFI